MTIPKGKHMFIWKIKNAQGGDPQAIATRAKALGLSGVIIKILSGPYRYNLRPPLWTDDIIQPVVDALKNVGIKTYGFQYNYLNNGKREAEAAIKRVNKFNLDGLWMDPEGEAKGKHTQAEAYIRIIKDSWNKDLPIGLCSYRFPYLHRELPWERLLQITEIGF